MPVQTRPAEPSLQQAPVLPVRAAGDGHLVPALLHSLRSLLCHGKRGPTGVCCHHSNIVGHCRQCPGKSANGTKETNIALLVRQTIVKHVFCPQIGLDKHYWTAVNHLFVWGSITIYFAILFAMQSNGMFGIFPSNFPFVGKSVSVGFV